MLGPILCNPITIVARTPFAGGVYDGTSIWMIPSGADRVIRISSVTGTATEIETKSPSATYFGTVPVTRSIVLTRSRYQPTNESLQETQSLTPCDVGTHCNGNAINVSLLSTD
eukprot:PhF_6_TR31464/c3_g4_i3/m.46200